MSSPTPLGIIPGLLFTAMLVFGFRTGTMPLFGYGSFDREEQPIAFWIMAVTNAFVALVGWYVAFWP